MLDFFETRLGKVIRYIMFIPIHFIVSMVVIAVMAYLFNRVGNWFGGLFIPGATGTAFGSMISSQVYPGMNKKRLIACYIAFFVTMNIISFILFIQSDEKISEQFETVTGAIGIFGGYLLAYKFTDSVN